MSDERGPVSCGLRTGKADGYTTMYSDADSDSGMGRPSSASPATCMLTASCMFFSASCRVAPVATHPGRSGEYAEKLPLAFSMTMRNLCMVSSFPSSLPA